MKQRAVWNCEVKRQAASQQGLCGQCDAYLFTKTPKVLASGGLLPEKAPIFPVMATSGGKRITQETFDECVRENVEEFEMEKAEALQDAIQQFTSQGVDLTNIDTTGADRETQRRATTEALASLKAAVTARDGAPMDDAAVREALNALAAGCTNQEGPADVDEGLDGGPVRLEKGVAVNQAVIAMAQGPTYLAALLGHEPLASEAIDCIAVVCRHSVECRDAFPPQGMAVLAKILTVQAELGAKVLREDSSAAAAAVAPAAAPATGALTLPVATGTYTLADNQTSWVYSSTVAAAAATPAQPSATAAAFASARALSLKVCQVIHIMTLRTENNKQGFVRKEAGGLPAIHQALQVFGDSDPALVAAACVALRTCTTFDDLRKDFAGAFDAAKDAVKEGMCKELLRLLEVHEKQPATVAAIFFALRAIACNDDAVQQVCAGGGLTQAEKHLQMHAHDASVCKQAAALLRNLAGNDAVKTSLCTVEMVQLLLGAVKTHVKDPAMHEHVIATFGAMALRVPSNCDRILACGGGKTITQALRRFPEGPVSLQRQCCLAVRNLVGRCPHLVESLSEDGMEPLLRHAGTLPGSVDAAYAALRDLGFEVEMLSIDPDTGEVRKGVAQFGEVKSAFRAVFDDGPSQDAAREALIAENAKSPKELGYRM